MSLSSVYIEDFDPTEPDGATKKLSVLDDHVRMMKSVLKNQLGSLGTTYLTVTAAELNGLAGVGGVELLSRKNAVSGYAGLDGSSKVPLTYLYAGVLNGLATLDASALLPTAQLPATIPVGNLADLPASKTTSGAFDTARIPSLDASKITTGTFGSSRLATDSVTATQIAANAVGSSEIAAGAVGTSEIATGGVDTDELATDAVTAAKIAANAVGSSEIAASAVGASEIAASGVGADEIAASAVGQSEVASGAIHQGELDTSEGEVATASSSYVALTLPGGSYGFYPQLRRSNSASQGGAQLKSLDTTTWPTSSETRITLTRGNLSGTVYAKQRYINASAPYDLGDGEVRSFIFLLVNSSGDIEASYAADAPPWAYNGPTDIGGKMIKTLSDDGEGVIITRSKVREVSGYEADLLSRGKTLEQDRAEAKGRGRVAERAHLQNLISSGRVQIPITTAFKNSDMDLIPHPFSGDLQGRTVVLLDPVSALMEEFNLMQRRGESIIDVVSEHITFDNTELGRKRPKGIMTVGCRWRT
jgi:hypothetical protein